MNEKELRIETGKRLKLAREHAGFSTAKAAAEALRLHRQNVVDQEAGRRGLSLPQLDYYARKYRVNYEWLGSGRGSMVEAESPINFWAKKLKRDDLDELIEIAKIKADKS